VSWILRRIPKYCKAHYVASNNFVALEFNEMSIDNKFLRIDDGNDG
jgi:hypothetical protein